MICRVSLLYEAKARVDVSWTRFDIFSKRWTTLAASGYGGLGTSLRYLVHRSQCFSVYISALELVIKFRDVEFARKMAAADLLGRAWSALRRSGAGDGDKVAFACTCCLS
jgi:hypothetical protein